MRPERRISPRHVGFSPNNNSHSIINYSNNDGNSGYGGIVTHGGHFDFDVVDFDSGHNKSSKLEHRRIALIGAIVVLLCVLCGFVLSMQPNDPPPLHVSKDASIGKDFSSVLTPIPVVVPPPITPKATSKPKAKPAALLIPDSRGCLDDLPEEYFHTKHIVVPPEGSVTLVCCASTKGPMNIAVHSAWAPLGAERFLDMVRSNFFSTKVPLFRALKGFLVQFGLAGDPAVQKTFHEKGNLVDDPPWLPLGPTGREINGTKRYQRGYWSYAGAGKNSRGTQLIMALGDNKFLGGGSPWEVPFGMLFGDESFTTISKIYTGYGEKPSQGKIMNRGVAYTKEEFPLMDYIDECHVTKEGVYWKHQP